MTTDNIQVGQPSFSLTPKNLAEAMEYSKLIADSEICPKGLAGKPGDVLVAIQYGMELGLSPLQGLQSIGVINGRPTVWGDAALAIVQSHPAYVSHEERNATEALREKAGRCVIRRRNGGQVTEHVGEFTTAEADRAGLGGKPGPWQEYPGRMLQMRARSFAMRDSFADALRGIQTREEVQDYHILDADVTVSTPASSSVDAFLAKPPPPEFPESEGGDVYLVSGVDEKKSQAGKSFWVLTLSTASGGTVEATTFSEALKAEAQDLEGDFCNAVIEVKESKGRTYRNLVAIRAAEEPEA